MKIRLALTATLALLSPALASALQPRAVEEPACEPRLEHDPRWRTLAVRGLDERCTLSVAGLAELLEAELARVTSGAHVPPDSLFLGRLIQYPELGAALLEAAAGAAAWQGERPPHAGEANRLVADALAGGPVAGDELAAVRGILAAHGLEPVGASCEKVLVVTDHPSVPEWARGRLGLPYDAMCWLRLRSP